MFTPAGGADGAATAGSKPDSSGASNGAEAIGATAVAVETSASASEGNNGFIKNP
jgi:hypothetical protein